MILTITGPSASGKTSLARALQTRHSDIGVLMSVTTREKRNSDVEYRYVTRDEFTEMEKVGEFIWTVDVHGHRYGTPKSAIRDALEKKMVIGILLISAVAKLRIYLESIGRLDGITSVYLDIKDEKMLRARLSKRGENPDDIEQRIRECRSWALERDASGVPFIILDGHANSDDLALEVEEHTKS